MLEVDSDLVNHQIQLANVESTCLSVFADCFADDYEKDVASYLDLLHVVLVVHNRDFQVIAFAYLLKLALQIRERSAHSYSQPS